ncbi:MAG: acetyl-CoA acetyltransferase [Actinomycetota bacterium]
MTIDPRTPVIVAVGQREQRPTDPRDALEPIDLLAEAARTADGSLGAASLIGRADTIAVVEFMSAPYPDPGRALARRIGADPARTVTTTIGGNTPQMLVHHFGRAIHAGEADVVLLGGVETVYSRSRARRTDPPVELPWGAHDAGDPACATVLGDDRPGTSDYENAHGAIAPTSMYPLFETAIRRAEGRTIEEHRRAVASLWEHFAAVAATNPHAWSPRALSGDEITLPSPDNRMVTFPYTKRMCANIQVDQAAAILLCSFGTARAAGVPSDLMVFPWSGAEANDHFHVSERWSLADSPAISAAVADALGAAGIGLDDVARFDLYSCFPSAVQLALRATGLAGPAADPRPLTVTGGLGFAGGPGNAYVVRSIAAMVEACRRDPGSFGLVTALGWYATKHAAGIYSTTPKPDGPVFVPKTRTQAVVDAQPSRRPAGAYSGEAEIEATSIVMDRDGSPAFGLVTLLTPDGDRAFANSTDVGLLSAMTVEAWEGRVARVRGDGPTNVVEA